MSPEKKTLISFLRTMKNSICVFTIIVNIYVIDRYKESIYVCICVFVVYICIHKYIYIICLTSCAQKHQLPQGHCSDKQENGRRHCFHECITPILLL